MSEVLDISPDEARRRVTGGAFLLDVREDDEFAAGHAPGAHHIALGDLVDHIADLPEGVEIVCVCRSGGRSRRAAEFLEEFGLRSSNVAGGMTAWADDGGPMVGDDGEPRVI